MDAEDHFPGGLRQSAVAFSIGNKGYVGTGVDALFNFYNDFWEYDPSNGSWTQKTDLLLATAKGVGFSIGNIGYLGTGQNDFGNQKTFYKYDPADNTWTQKTDFGGTAREGGIGFSLDGSGYIGAGFNGSANTNDFWQYDTTANAWTQVTGLSGAGRSNTAGFVIGNKAYVGTGTPGLSDLWEYSPDPLGINRDIRSTPCIYPNPVKDYFRLKGLSNAQKVNVFIYSMTGQLLLSVTTTTSMPVDMTLFAKGAYLVTVQNDSGDSSITATKLIRQ